MKNSALIAAALLSVGCNATTGKEASRGVVAPPSGGGDVMVGAIADAALAKGECGMILWTLEANQPAPVFRMADGKGGEMNINGNAVKFSIVETGGAAGFGVFEDQSLVAEGYKVSVKVRFGLGFDGGSYLERGLVTVESDSGWRAVIPTAGVAGCRVK